MVHSSDSSESGTPPPGGRPAPSTPPSENHQISVAPSATSTPPPAEGQQTPTRGTGITGFAGRENWLRGHDHTNPFKFPDGKGGFEVHYWRFSISQGRGSQRRWLQHADGSWNIEKGEETAIHTLPVARFRDPGKTSHCEGLPTSVSPNLRNAQAGALRLSSCLILEATDGPEMLWNFLASIYTTSQFLLEDAVGDRLSGTSNASKNGGSRSIMKLHAEKRATDKERAILLSAWDLLDGLQQIGEALDTRSDTGAKIFWPTPKGSTIGNVSYQAHEPVRGTQGAWNVADLWYPDQDED